MHPLGAKTRKIEQVIVKPVVSSFFLEHRGLVRLPRAVEERQDAVIEQVEKIAQRGIPGARERSCLLGIQVRHHTLRPGEPEKVHRHARRRVSAVPALVGKGERLDLARRKPERRACREACDFGGGIGPPADRCAPGAKPSQQTNGLKEREGRGLLTQHALQAPVWR